MGAGCRPAPGNLLEELLSTHTRLAAGGRGLAPSAGTAGGLRARDFASADRDGDGLLSRDEFVQGHHRALAESGRPVPPELRAEVARLQALCRARRAQAARPAAGPTPGAAVRTLIQCERAPAAPAGGEGPAGQRTSERSARRAGSGEPRPGS